MKKVITKKIKKNAEDSKENKQSSFCANKHCGAQKNLNIELSYNPGNAKRNLNSILQKSI